MRWSRSIRPWPRRRPEQDPRAVGITFVDVLFALVVAEILEPLRRFDDLPVAGVVHLGLAGVLVLTSWIGYHNSWNRPSYFIRFPNWPLAQFLIDVALVVVYWLMAVNAEGVAPQATTPPSAAPEAVLVACSFVLYACWDWVGVRIRMSDAYLHRPLAKDAPKRRRVTQVCAGLSLVVAGATFVLNPDSGTSVILVDSMLGVLLIGYRFAKEYVTDPRASDVEEEDLVLGFRRAVGDLEKLAERFKMSGRMSG